MVKKMDKTLNKNLISIAGILGSLAGGALIALALGLMFLIATLDSVSAVGFFGAYLILFGVHWGIASATPGSK